MCEITADAPVSDVRHQYRSDTTGDTRQRHNQPADGERDVMPLRFSGDRRIDAVDRVQDLLDYVAIRHISLTDTKNGHDVAARWSSLPL